jgi:uncharacterized phiE125 gp8 family phage protein
MAMELITAAAPVVSWAEADAHLRLDDDTSQQAYVEGLIAAATAHLEAVTNQAFGAQTWELTLDAFPAGEILLPLGPLISIASVKYDDVDAVEATVASENYVADSARNPGYAVPVSGYVWPATAAGGINAVRVSYQAGRSLIPPQVKPAVLLLTEHWYNNRSAVSELSLAEVPIATYPLIASLRLPAC